MKRSTTMAMVLLPLVLVTLFIFASQSEALVVADASTTLDWSSLTITLSPGMSFAWQWYYSNAYSKIDVDSVQVAYDDKSAASWDGWDADLNSTASYPGIYHESINNASGLLSVYSELNNAGFEVLDATGWVQRTGRFIVTGNGTVSFSIDYQFDTFASNTGPDRGSAAAKAVLSLNNLDNYNGYFGDVAVEAYLSSFAVLSSGQTVSKTDAGTMTVSFDFTDGQRGEFITQGGAFTHYYPLAKPVPEPSMLSLLGCALAGLVLLKKNRS